MSSPKLTKQQLVFENGKYQYSTTTTQHNNIINQLAKQREETIHDIRERDKGVRAWRKRRDTKKLHDIEHAEFQELERFQNTLQNEDNATLSSIEMNHIINNPLNQKGETASTTTTTNNETKTTSKVTLTSKPPGKSQTTSGLARFKQAGNRIKAQNSIRNTFDVTYKRTLSKEHHITEPHCHVCVGPSKIVFHLLSLLMIWSLTQSLWTYDGLDAVEMIETQIFRDSLYDHFYSTYTEVDNHASFQTYVPTLLNKLYKRPDPPNPLTGVSATRPILRYRHSSTLEKVCKTKYQNKSFPFEDNAANKDGCIESSSYKTFRPLSNSQNGLVYLSDGVIIRQLRGAVHKGKFTSTDEEIHCGSKKITPEDPNMWTSGAWGLYMKYPSNQGYDLYYSAEDKQKDVLNDWTIKNNSTKCGWIDEKTRAVIFVFTLTFFTDDTNLHQLPNTVVDQSSAFQAYGEYIEVSVKMLFDMPSNGVVRATHQFAVIDKTDITLKWFCFFALVCLNFIKVIYHITDLRFLGITSYFTWIHVLQLASLGLFWISCSAYLWADQRKRFFPLDSARVLTDTTYGEYMCGSLINVEENAQKTSTYLFLTLFSWYSVIEFWMIIHYFRVFPIIMIPLTALSNSALEIAFFFLVFFIVVVGFAFGAHIVFGEVFEFRSIFHSVITLLLVSVDELDSKEIFESTQHSMYGYIYVYVFRMIAAVVFLNIFIVIVLVQYEIARAEKRYVVDEMHAFMLYWGGKIVSMYGSMRTCCSKKHTKEEYVVRYRKWYHDWREKASGKNQFPPLRHDTEVIMSQLSQIKLTVECLMQNQKKERKQIIISKARIKNSE